MTNTDDWCYYSGPTPRHTRSVYSWPANCPFVRCNAGSILQTEPGQTGAIDESYRGLGEYLLQLPLLRCLRETSRAGGKPPRPPDLANSFMNPTRFPQSARCCPGGTRSSRAGWCRWPTVRATTTPSITRQARLSRQVPRTGHNTASRPFGDSVSQPPGVIGANNLQWPSETTSTAPPWTLRAVSSSIA